jgi:hypothetical protein
MHVGSSLLSSASPFLAFFTLVLLIIPQSPVSLILIPRLPMTLIRNSSVFPSVPQSCVLNQPVLRLIHPPWPPFLPYRPNIAPPRLRVPLLPCRRISSPPALHFRFGGSGAVRAFMVLPEFMVPFKIAMRRQTLCAPMHDDQHRLTTSAVPHSRSHL